MANNGRWHGLNVQFDLISINQLAVRKLSKQTRLGVTEGENFPFCWRRFVALENAVVALQMFEAETINQRVADFKVATICGTTTRKLAGIPAMSAMSCKALGSDRRQAGDTFQLTTLARCQIVLAKCSFINAIKPVLTF